MKKIVITFSDSNEKNIAESIKYGVLRNFDDLHILDGSITVQDISDQQGILQLPPFMGSRKVGGHYARAK